MVDELPLYPDEFDESEPQKAQDLLKNEYLIRSELNLERWPGIWQAANKTTEFNEIRTIERKIKLNNKEILAKVTIVPDLQFGTLNTEDQKTLYALLSIWEKKGRPDKIHFTIRGILKALDRQYGKIAREGIINSLKRLKAVDITWENSFFDKTQNKTIKQLAMFNIISFLSLTSEESEESVEDEITVTFHELIHSNLKSYHSIPTKYHVLIGIKNPLAQLVYKYIEPRLYSATRFERRTKDLLKDLAIQSARYHKLSNRVDALNRAIRELQGLKIQNGVLSVYLEPSKDNDYKLVAIKTKNQTDQISEMAADVAEKIVQTENETSIIIEDESSINKIQIGQELEVFEVFRRKFKLARKRPTLKEFEKAKHWIELFEGSLQTFEKFIEFAEAEAQKTSFKIQNLAGLEQYFDQFINPSPPAKDPDPSVNQEVLVDADPAPPASFHTEKEKAFQCLRLMSETEQAYWCQSAKSFLHRSEPATLKKILSFTPEVQKETLLAVAARQFAAAILIVAQNVYQFDD